MCPLTKLKSSQTGFLKNEFTALKWPSVTSPTKHFWHVVEWRDLHHGCAAAKSEATVNIV